MIVRWLCLAALLMGCEERAPPRGDVDSRGKPIPRMEAAEQERGLELCERYVARVCACPELREQCELARGQPEGLKLHLALLRGAKGPLNDNERRMTQASARKIVAACVEADGRLEPTKCPRR